MRLPSSSLRWQRRDPLRWLDSSHCLLRHQLHHLGTSRPSPKMQIWLSRRGCSVDFSKILEGGQDRRSKVRLLHGLFRAAEAHAVLFGAGCKEDTLELFRGVSDLESFQQNIQHCTIVIPILLFAVLLQVSGKEDALRFNTLQLFCQPLWILIQVDGVMCNV